MVNKSAMAIRAVFLPIPLGASGWIRYCFAVVCVPCSVLGSPPSERPEGPVWVVGLGLGGRGRWATFWFPAWFSRWQRSN